MSTLSETSEDNLGFVYPSQSGAGSVTSVGLSTNVPWLVVGNSPIASSGVITLNENFTADGSTYLDSAGNFTEPTGKLTVQDIGNVTTAITTGVDIVRLTTALTANRTLTLPLASAYNTKRQLKIIDTIGIASASFKLNITRSGSDTVNGTTTFSAITVSNNGSSLIMVSDGVSAWHSVYQPCGTDSVGKLWQSGSSGFNQFWTAAIYPVAGGVANKVMMTDGTDFLTSTPTFPVTSAATLGNVITGDGTNWVSAALKAVSYTVATLPSPLIGMMATVTDGAGSLAWGATVTAGGSTKYLVWYNGTNWTVMGK